MTDKQLQARADTDGEVPPKKAQKKLQEVETHKIIFEPIEIKSMIGGETTTLTYERLAVS